MQLSTRARSRTWPATVVTLAVLACVPLLPIPDRMQFVISIGMVFAMAGVGLDIFSGYGGQLMLGSFGFVGIGAYASAVLGTDYDWPIWATLPVSALTSGTVALVLGAAMVRLPDLGTALGTFFFGFVVMILLRGRTLAFITHGSAGIPVQELDLGSFPLNVGVGLYWLSFGCLCLVALASYRYANSRAGRVLQLIKRSPVVASAMGVNVYRHRLTAFVYTAMCAGVGGFVYAQTLGFLASENFSASESIDVLTMAIVGGLGSIARPVIGAMTFSVLTELSRAAAADREVLFAFLLLASLIFFPGGLYGAIEWAARRASGRHITAGATAERRDVTRIREHRDGPSSSAVFRPDITQQRNAFGAGLRLDGIGVSYGGVQALTDISIFVEERSIHAIMGPNGAGKTTLLNCISGLQSHTGTIRLGSDVMSGLTADEVRRRGVTRTFQHPSLVLDLSASENVELGLYGGEPSLPLIDVLPLQSTLDRDRRARAAASDALDLVGFPGHRRHVLAADLTLAEQKIVDIARAAAGSRRLLLLDEPTAGLAESEIDEIARVLQTVSERFQLTIVVIAHHIGFIREVAQRATVLDFGRLVTEGTPEEVTARPDVVAIFLGEADV